MTYDEISAIIDQKDEYTVGALMRLYEYQTDDEKVVAGTKHKNDVGFNGIDAPILSDMAQFYKNRGYLTPRQIAFIRKTIKKYINQLLGNGGFNPVEIKQFTPKNGNGYIPQKPCKNASLLKSKTTDELTGIQVKFSFPKGNDEFAIMLENVKSLIGRTWMKEEKYWKVNLTFENVEKLATWGFEFSEGLQSWYNNVMGKDDKKKQKIILANEMILPELPGTLADAIRKQLTFPNPEYEDKIKLDITTMGTPKYLKYYRYDQDGKNLFIPRGFLHNFLELASNEKISCQIEDQRRFFPDVAFQFNGKLRNFQELVVDEMLKEDFGTLCAPTGSGKTVMALNIIARRKQPTLIVVHTKELLDQWIERAETFLGIPADEIGRIGGGSKTVGKRLTIALVQTLYKIKDDVKDQIGFLIIDECHRAPSRTFTEAVKAFDCKYMLGLSATPWRRDRLTKLIFFHLGNMHQKVEMETLVKTGDVMKAEYVIRGTNFRPFHDPVNEYSKMLSELTKDEPRNKLIVADIIEQAKNGDGTLLILTDRKKHCEDLQGMLFEQGIDSEVLVGSVSKNDRTAIVEKLNSGKVKIVIATGQLIGEGFDCKRLSILFLATPIKFNGRLIQYLGRILRPMEGKKNPVVYDYVDYKVRVLIRAAQGRQNVYDGNYND